MAAKSTMTGSAVLDRDFLSLRHRILDIAAGLDRLDRAAGAEPVMNDPRLQSIRDALAILAEPGQGRTERVQLVFSDPYDEGWRST